MYNNDRQDLYRWLLLMMSYARLEYYAFMTNYVRA